MTMDQVALAGGSALLGMIVLVVGVVSAAMIADRRDERRRKEDAVIKSKGKSCDHCNEVHFDLHDAWRYHRRLYYLHMSTREDLERGRWTLPTFSYSPASRDINQAIANQRAITDRLAMALGRDNEL